MNHGLNDHVEISEAPVRPRRDPAATIRAHARNARMHLLTVAFDREKWAELVELAVERATTKGQQEYGDGAWSKLPADLRIDQDEELADWIFYFGAEADVTAERR